MSAGNKNKKIYDENWDQWSDMKEIGPASRWLRELIHEHIKNIYSYELNTILDLGCGQGNNTFYMAKWLPSTKVKGQRHRFFRNRYKYCQKTL